jgi:uncharacterized protein
VTDVQPEVAAATDAAAEAETTEETDATDATEETGAAQPDPPALEETLPETTPDPAPAFRVMDLEDVSLDLPTQYPAVTLVEAQPPMRALVFPVGLPEGTAMAQAMRRMEGRRPMTHELFVQVLQRARIDVIAVRLVGRQDGNLLADLDLMTSGGREVLDCRPSDGIVLALRMAVPAPILVDERLLEDLGDVVPHGATGSDQIGS